MPTTSSDQLPLDLALRPAMGREDFLVSSVNEAAVAAIDAWPEWPSPVLILVGEPGSGKSHLCDVWRASSRADVIPASELTDNTVAGLAEKAKVVLAVEDVPGDSLDETALFHLINLVRETRGHLLMTSQSYPAHWPVALPDLRSRLKAAQIAPLGSPDDDLLRGVLVKLFADRQLRIDDTIITFMLKRMERSFESARALVANIDEQALSDKAEITRKFVSRVMQDEDVADQNAGSD